MGLIKTTGKGARRVEEGIRRILNEPYSSQQPTAEVEQGNPILLGKTKDAIASGAWGKLVLWSGPKGEEVPTTNEVAVYNRGPAVGKDKWFHATYVLNGYELTWGIC